MRAALGWLLVGLAPASCTRSLNEDPDTAPPAAPAVSTALGGGSAYGALSYDDVANFAETVWAPVMSAACYGCHHQGGIGEQLGSGLVFADFNLPNALERNFEVSRLFAAQANDVLLAKASGELDHYGGQIVAPDSDAYAILAAFSARSQAATGAASTAPPTLAEVLAQAVIPEPARQLRRAALTLAGRLPTAAELSAVAAQADLGMSAGVTQYLSEPAILARLAETYNDSLLVDTYARLNTATSLVTEVANIDWYNRVAWSSAQDAALATTRTNQAIAHEPLQLIAYIAAQNRPFTEVVTAPYRVFNPYSACAYGVADRLTFAGPVTCTAAEHADYDPTDLQPLTLAGEGPEAGMLSHRAWLVRHPTTPTNKNRHRSNTINALFLGFNVLEAVPGPQAPAVVNQPASTMVNHSCTPCHALLDPGAGTFQNWDGGGLWTQAPWPNDMFVPGYFGTPLPAGTDPLTWAGQQIAADDRFARQTAVVMYQMLTGNQVSLQPPQPGDAYAARLAAHMLQKEALDGWAADFKASGYVLKTLLAKMVSSPLFQATDALPTADAATVTTLASGLLHRRLITPESLDRTISGLFGQSWQDSQGQSNLLGAYYMFYGGIDSQAVTVRDGTFTAFKSDISLRMATELSCALVPLALGSDTGAQAQLLRTTLLPGMLPGGGGIDGPGRAAIMASMRLTLLGEARDTASPEVAAMEALFSTVKASAAASPAGLPAACQVGGVGADPDGSVRAWMAVAALVLADENFLFE